MNTSKAVFTAVIISLISELLIANAFAQFSTVVNSPPDPVPGFIGVDTQLNLHDGGVLPYRYSVGESSGTNANVELNVFGGVVNEYLQIQPNSVVNVSGGIVGVFVNIGTRATLKVSGGTIGNYAQLGRGATLEVSGGAVGFISSAASPSTILISGGEVLGFRTRPGNTVLQTGGSMGWHHEANSQSRYELSGGTFGLGLYAGSNSNFTVRGGEFRLAGIPIAELSEIGSRVTFGDNFDPFPDEDLTGTLADGTPFSFGNAEQIRRVTLETVALPDAGPVLLNAPTDTLPKGLREGQSLVVGNGGVVPAHFRAGWGSSVTVEPGGVLGADFQAIDATVDILGGEIGRSFSASNSIVNISGGRVVEGMYFLAGNFGSQVEGTLSISGGTFADGMTRPSQFNISGTDFRLNGMYISGLNDVGDLATLRLDSRDIFTGILADGTPFAFFEDDVTGLVQITKSDVPAIQAETIIASTDPIPLGIRDGQTLIVDRGGIVPDHFNAGVNSIVNISDGGAIGNNFESTGANVTVTGGSIGREFDAFDGSNVIVTGGSFGGDFDAFPNSHVEISGGAFGDGFDATEGSHVTFVGSDFRLDGVPLTGLDAVGNRIVPSVPTSALLTGTFADGTPFVFGGENLAPRDSDYFAANTLTLELADLPPAKALITASIDGVPLGVREGQTLIADAGSVIPDNFNAGRGSSVRIEAGSTVGDNFEAYNADVTITGGSIGSQFDAFDGSVVTISGGTFGPNFQALAGSEIHFIGESFQLNGAPIDGLTTSGDSLILDDREQVITGVLQDGNSFWLNLTFGIFHDDATLRLTIAGGTSLDCDFDGNGLCELADIDSLLTAISTNDVDFDLDDSGVVDAADIAAWLTSAGNENIGRPYLSGDASLDGAVNATDLNRVGQNWLGTVSSWADGDFNGDRSVNPADLNQVGQNWLQGAASPITASVPEPSLGLLSAFELLIFLAVAKRRRRVFGRG